MQRLSFFLYGLASYALFLGVFVYAVAFLGNFIVPNTIDAAPRVGFGVALAVNLALAVGFFVSWLLGRPVVRGYQVDKLGEEKASHPVMVHMASRMSVMFTIAFSSAALISAIWPESDWAMLICNLIVGGAFLTAYKIYPAYVKNNTDEIAALYEDEIAEWEAKHPEINFAGELA